MNTTQMVFDESYGNLPKSTLRLIRKYNVSQADYDMILDLLGLAAWNGVHTLADWDMIDDHIVSNSETGMYRPRFF